MWIRRRELGAISNAAGLYVRACMRDFVFASGMGGESCVRNNEHKRLRRA